jgi:hypothetical protein
MKRLILCIAVATALVATAPVDAAKQPAGKKLYRWVDKDGKVQFSDSLPPEAIDQARTEMSNSGRVVRDVDRALTPEELAAAELAAAEAARLEAEAEQQRKSEEAMLASFQTEEDLKRSMNLRVTLLQQTLDAIEAGIASQRASLSALLLQATETELEGGRVKPKQVASIRELHREIGKQQQMLVVKRGELGDVDSELEHLLERFRELRAERDGAAAPAPTPDGGEPATEEATGTPATEEAGGDDAPTG